jgi:hypothetical protein
MDWYSKAVVFAFLVYLAFQVERIPSRLDRWLRSLAIEYKRWSDQDSVHARVIREERDKNQSERRIRRMEMNREDEANSFRKIDDRTAKHIAKRNEEELKQLDELEQAEKEKL